MNVKESKFIITLSLIVVITFLSFVATFSSTLSLEAEEYKFDSLIYNINESYIENISINTTIDLFNKYFDLENCTIEVIYNNKILTKEDYVPNGSKTILYNKNNNAIGSYTNIIKGDFDENGTIDNNDLEKIGKCLVENCTLEDYQLKSLDVSKDNEVHINDLVLLDKAITTGYTNITLIESTKTIRLNEHKRLLLKIEPEYGIDQNIKWISLDENIVTVDNVGRIFGNNGGETIVQAIAPDGTKLAETKVIVDNSIILESYEGEAYTNGYEKKIHIDILNYENLSCLVSNPTIASCTIEGEYLIIKALNMSNATITINAPKYKPATYKLSTGFISMNVSPRYACNKIGPFVISGYNHEELIFESSDTEVVKRGYTKLVDGKNRIFLEYGDKYGSATIKVKASTGDVYREITVDRSSININGIGTFTKVGEELKIPINGYNIGNLECAPKDANNKAATCKIEDQTLIINTLEVGDITFKVTNSFNYIEGWQDTCNTATYRVVIEE